MVVVNTPIGLAVPAILAGILIAIVGPVSGLLVLGIGFLLIPVLGLYCWSVLNRRLPRQQKGTVAFFHPNANGGGGGERVLWVAVQALQESKSHIKILIYTADSLPVEDLLDSATKSFNLHIHNTIEVVHLKSAHLLLPETWPRFTLLGQGWGSLVLAYEALQQFVPEVFVDTSGWACTYPLARMAGCQVAAYVHYPAISTDMLQRVRDRSPAFNNATHVSSSWPKSIAKLAYYYCFAALYGAAGGHAHVVMANSSWTARHVRRLFWSWKPPLRVFPPCNTETLQSLPLDRKLKRLFLISVAQFRPEKNHALQLSAYALARQRAATSHTEEGAAVLASRLKLIGSCRNEADEARVTALRAQAKDLGVAGDVDFLVGLPFDELRELLGGAVGGLHTMRDEHFGIGIVEYMAAGVVPIAHNSGGPGEDIVGAESRGRDQQPCGYLCTSEEEYAEAITKVLAMSQTDRLQIAAAARRRSTRFSDELFQKGFLDALEPILPTARPPEPSFVPPQLPLQEPLQEPTQNSVS